MGYKVGRGPTIKLLSGTYMHAVWVRDRYTLTEHQSSLIGNPPHYSPVTRYTPGTWYVSYGYDMLLEYLFSRGFATPQQQQQQLTAAAHKSKRISPITHIYKPPSTTLRCTTSPQCTPASDLKQELYRIVLGSA